jgi:hypothetical protein
VVIYRVFSCGTKDGRQKQNTTWDTSVVSHSPQKEADGRFHKLLPRTFFIVRENGAVSVISALT